MSAYRIEGIIGEGNSTASAVSAYLAQHPSGANVVINSPGGCAFEGSAMLAELERHGNVTVIVQGIAASAASLAMCGGKTIIAHPDAVIMIHEPGAVSFGTADGHRRTADTLDKLTATYAAAYARATGHPVARIASWMKAESWMTASEALALNFIDRIEGDGQPVAVAQFDFTRFQHAPASLVRMARANGWATASPDTGKKETTDA
ncbi:Clp protease ClpP [Rhodobacteraceae bacterium 2376]|uniref:ATP-dependent Clp protease proteolytic subunit n=1 Tax=Rhabdonatronobacter sediminivivens TaxID=2743469 RepID=A0A7Z0HYH3_9RHOB|nr:head maturation protease, ClpP-related [Rhabdonatronobacter sediminivivens]NYS24597.1 Clp protease ClpP [Rhabdonatronobacter sediminivivens]